jgi:hypothetical protein
MLKRLAAPMLALVLVGLAACRGDDVTSASPRSLRRPSFLTGVTLTVTNTSDGGSGSLRQAIADAADGDLIQFDPTLGGQTITLSSAPLVVSGKSITIEGSATKGITVSGAGALQVLVIGATGGLTLANASIVNGRSDNNDGGGIVNHGTLAIRHSTISGNRAVGNPGYGGGIFSDGTLTITNSTISGNSADLDGGGILTIPEITVTNSTITGNTADRGGGIRGQTRLHNSIVANNSATSGSDPNCYGFATALGVNISNDDSCAPAGIGMIIADPKLGPLADNGGPTRTHAPLKDSPAVDGATFGCPVADDQRHIARPQGTACDIGAVEFSDYVKVTITVDASQAVVPSTGVAVVTGTITCSAPTTIPLDVKLSQVQKDRRVTATVTASGLTTIGCAGKKPWSVSMVPPSGAFLNTDASVTASSLSSDKWVTPASITKPVKLYWGHK